MKGLSLAVAFLAFLPANALARDLPGLVRDLNILQNRMATGDIAARDRAALQYEVIEKAIDAADPASWAEERNVRAAIVYLLCGGAPGKLREIYEAHRANEKMNALFGASLAYAEGKEGGAPRELLSMDPREYQQVLGGHLALVQAGAQIGKDDAQALALLDIARLLMPGSLVEEAALRREVALLDAAQDADKLALLALRYASYYSGSPYARNFWDALLRATLGEPAAPSRAAKFERVFDKAPAPVRATAYLALARQAMIAGRLEDARAAIEKAATGADTESEKRVAVYRRIFAALSEEGGGPALGKIDPKTMSRNDAALAAMASSVVSALSARDAKTLAAAKDETYEILATVRQAIDASDELLKRAAPK